MLAMDFRMYDARLGRWWGQDPIVNPTRSPYIGMGNNPVNFADPLGLKERTEDLPAQPTPRTGHPGGDPPAGGSTGSSGSGNHATTPVPTLSPALHNAVQRAVTQRVGEKSRSSGQTQTRTPTTPTYGFIGVPGTPTTSAPPPTTTVGPGSGPLGRILLSFFSRTLITGLATLQGDSDARLRQQVADIAKMEWTEFEEGLLLRLDQKKRSGQQLDEWEEASYQQLKNEKWENTGSDVPYNKVINWTNHNWKHFPPKGLTDKQLRKATAGTDKPALYKPGLDIEQFERMIWDQGEHVKTRHTWKVMKFDHVIGWSAGKDSYWVRVEYSGGTIHGHPITEKEYNDHTK